MTSDDERREVARRLRENAGAHPKMSLILNLAFADDSLRPDGAMEWKVTPHDAAMRLADLIEPVERACYYYDSETNHCGCYDTRLVDRDALLALADEMDTVAASKEIRTVPYWYLDNYAERIREALGVES